MNKQEKKPLIFKDFLAALRARGRGKEAEHYQQFVKDKFQNELTQDEIFNLSIDDIATIFQVYEVTKRLLQHYSAEVAAAV